MFSGPVKSRIFPFGILLLLCACSGNVIQTTVFSDGFQEMETGAAPYLDSTDPAIYFQSQRGVLGEWMVATSYREKGFEKAWQVMSEDGGNYLAQTFTNLNHQNEPLSLITHPLIVAGDTLWTDHTIEVEFTPMAKFDKCGLVFKYQHPSDFYFFGIEGNTVTLKLIQQPVTPMRPIEQILDYRPLVWTPGDRFHAMVTVRRNTISTILNDSIRMYVDKASPRPGRIGLISDLPAKFHRVTVRVLKGEQRKLNRRRRQLTRREDLQFRDHPKMVRWKAFDISEYGSDQNIRLGDITGDGNKEILFVRAGVGTIASVDYISAMDLNGNRLWEFGTRDNEDRPPGDEQPVQVHDLDGDGSREVIFISKGMIHILEGKTGDLIERVPVPGELDARTLTFGDLMGIGRDNCILLSDRESRIAVLNEKFELLWQQEVQNGSHPLVRDLDGDGYQDVMMGYSVFDHQGTPMFDVGAFIGDGCNGIAVNELLIDDRMVPSLVYAAGDWGLMYFDFQGNLLKQNIMGHVRFVSIADLDVERPGLEAVTSNGWGSDGLVHIVDASGQPYVSYMSNTGAGRCLPVNWKGDGEEFFMVNADSIQGGLFDGAGQIAVEFPSDGHPSSCYLAQDLTGDTRDEILVWDRDELWIYTQDDNPRMGNTFAPHRLPLHSHSMYRMSHSVPGW